MNAYRWVFRRVFRRVFGRNSNLNRTLSGRRIFRQLNRQINWRRVVRFGRSWLNRINGLNACRWVFRRCWIFHNRHRRYGWRGSTASFGLSGRRPIKCGSSLHPVVIALRGIRPILIAVVHPVVGNVTLDILSEVSYSATIKPFDFAPMSQRYNVHVRGHVRVIVTRKICRVCHHWAVVYRRFWRLVVIVTRKIWRVCHQWAGGRGDLLLVVIVTTAIAHACPAAATLEAP